MMYVFLYGLYLLKHMTIHYIHTLYSHVRYDLLHGPVCFAKIFLNGMHIQENYIFLGYLYSFILTFSIAIAQLDRVFYYSNLRDNISKPYI